MKSKIENLNAKIKNYEHLCNYKGKQFMIYYRETCRGSYGREFTDFLDCVLVGVKRMRRMVEKCKKSFKLDLLIEKSKEAQKSIRKQRSLENGEIKKYRENLKK